MATIKSGGEGSKRTDWAPFSQYIERYMLKLCFVQPGYKIKEINAYKVRFSLQNSLVTVYSGGQTNPQIKAVFKDFTFKLLT